MAEQASDPPARWPMLLPWCSNPCVCLLSCRDGEGSKQSAPCPRAMQHASGTGGAREPGGPRGAGRGSGGRSGQSGGPGGRAADGGSCQQCTAEGVLRWHGRPRHARGVWPRAPQRRCIPGAGTPAAIFSRASHLHLHLFVRSLEHVAMIARTLPDQQLCLPDDVMAWSLVQ